MVDWSQMVLQLPITRCPLCFRHVAAFGTNRIGEGFDIVVQCHGESRHHLLRYDAFERQEPDAYGAVRVISKEFHLLIDSLGQCVEHSDCREHYEIGKACFLARRPDLRQS